MMNVYAIYISMKSGDVEITRTFSRYSRAIASLQEVIEKYITDRGLTNNSKIVTKADFVASNVSKDKTFPNGYCFRKGKNSVIIYKKTTDVGYIKNAVTFEEVGKIGVCDFDVRLPSGVHNRNNRNSRSGLRSRYKNRRSLGNNEVEENPSDDDCEVGTISKVTNQEHGRYITMIEELKSVLDNRRNRMNLKSFDEDNNEDTEGKEDEDNNEEQEDGSENRNDKGKEEEEIVDPFLLHLEQVRTNLNNVPVPVVKIGYALGKVVDNNDDDRYDEYSKEYDYSNDRYDVDENKENNDNNKLYRSHSALNITDCLGSNDNIRYSL